MAWFNMRRNAFPLLRPTRAAGLFVKLIAQVTCNTGEVHRSTLALMKNIQVIDGAANSVYDIFAATDEEFSLIFPEGQDIAFIDEVYDRGNAEALEKTFNNIWRRRIPKREANGIHGLLFYGLEEKKVYYPTRKDEDAINPNGSRLR